jgi:four helix bundle protein
LTSQIRRAAVSVPTNIVEGTHSSTTADYLHFLTIALGSLAETGYLISLSERLDYLDKNVADDLTKQQTTSIKILPGLINSLREPKFKG